MDKFEDSEAYKRWAPVPQFDAREKEYLEYLNRIIEVHKRRLKNGRSINSGEIASNESVPNPDKER